MINIWCYFLNICKLQTRQHLLWNNSILGSQGGQRGIGEVTITSFMVLCRGLAPSSQGGGVNTSPPLPLHSLRILKESHIPTPHYFFSFLYLCVIQVRLGWVKLCLPCLVKALQDQSPPQGLELEEKKRKFKDKEGGGVICAPRSKEGRIPYHFIQF